MSDNDNPETPRSPAPEPTEGDLPDVIQPLNPDQIDAVLAALRTELRAHYASMPSKDRQDHGQVRGIAPAVGQSTLEQFGVLIAQALVTLLGGAGWSSGTVTPQSRSSEAWINSQIDRQINAMRSDALLHGGLPKGLVGWLFRHDESNRHDSLDGVEEDKEKQIQIISAWSGRKSGQTAIEHFNEHFAALPIEQRPMADEVRHASLRYYESLAQYQSRRGLSIGNLFRIDEAARGGSKAKLAARPPLTPEEALAEFERRREAKRLRSKLDRARRKAEQNKPG